MLLSRDFVGGIGTIVIGAVYYFYASQIRVSALDDTVGPGGIPKAYGLIMVGLGLAIAGGALLKAWRARDAEGGLAAEWAGQGRRVVLAAGILGIGILYLLTVPYIGYAPGIAALLLATAAYQGAPFGWRLFAISAGGAAALWAIFVLLLDVSMPPGTLWPF